MTDIRFLKSIKPFNEPEKTERILSFVLILMGFSGLAMVALCHFAGIKIGREVIIAAYALYFFPCLIILGVNFRKQLFISTIDWFMTLFFMIIFFGLAIKLYSGEWIKVQRNFGYFLLFVISPYFLGRTATSGVIRKYGNLLLGCALLITLSLAIPGVATYDPIYGRPTFFSTEFSRISLAFSLGLGAILTTGRAQASSGRYPGLGYALALILILIGLSYVTLRAPYYLATLLVVVMIFIRKSQQNRWLIAAVFLGVLIGSLVSSDFSLYHSKITNIKTEQLPLSNLHQDFFGKDAFNVQAGRSVLSHVDCLPAKISDDSIMIRAVLYLEAIKLFLYSPLFGVGVSNFSNYSCFSPHGFPHSTILHVAAEMGVLGLSLFLISIIFAAQRLCMAVQGHAIERWILFSFIYFLILDQGFASYFFSLYTYFFIGLASRLSSTYGSHLNLRQHIKEEN